MIGRSAITLAALLLAANAQADTLPTMPRGAVVCDADPATGERAVIVPPRLETVTVSFSPLYQLSQYVLSPAILSAEGSVETSAEISRRVIPYMGHFPLQRRQAEPAREARLSEFAVGTEYADGANTDQYHQPDWDYHLYLYGIRLRAEQHGATEPLWFDGNAVLVPTTVNLEISNDAPTGTPARVIIEPHVIQRESEAEAVDAYHAAAREWAASLPEVLHCDGHEIVSKPVDLGPMPERTFADIGIRRVTQRREGSVRYYNRAGAEIVP